MTSRHSTCQPGRGGWIDRRLRGSTELNCTVDAMRRRVVSLPRSTFHNLFQQSNIHSPTHLHQSLDSRTSCSRQWSRQIQPPKAKERKRQQNQKRATAIPTRMSRRDRADHNHNPPPPPPLLGLRLRLLLACPLRNPNHMPAINPPVAPRALARRRRAQGRAALRGIFLLGAPAVHPAPAPVRG
jgi:hypothetical protein